MIVGGSVGRNELHEVGTLNYDDRAPSTYSNSSNNDDDEPPTSGAGVIRGIDRVIVEESQRLSEQERKENE